MTPVSPPSILYHGHGSCIIMPAITSSSSTSLPYFLRKCLSSISYIGFFLTIRGVDQSWTPTTHGPSNNCNSTPFSESASSESKKSARKACCGSEKNKNQRAWEWHSQHHQEDSFVVSKRWDGYFARGWRSAEDGETSCIPQNRSVCAERAAARRTEMKKKKKVSSKKHQDPS